MMDIKSTAKGKIIGLTGGIASGKSMVASFLKENHYPVVDFDNIVKEIKKRPDVQNRLKSLFGTSDSLELKEIIFQDNAQQKRQILNQEIGFPALIEALEMSNKFFEEGFKVIIWDAALIIESELYLSLDANILIVAEENIRLKRLMLRDNISKFLGEKIIKTQLSDDVKINKLLQTKKYLIVDNNNSSFEFMNKMNNVKLFIENLNK